MTTEYTVFDASKYLDSDEMVAEYLTACAEDDNPDVLLAALADVAKARGMKQVAEAAGLGRESLYKTLAPRAHPRFRTIQAILKALNVRVVLKPPSDLERVDAHVIQPEEYADAPEITDAMLERADLYEGDKLIRRGRRPLASPKQAIKLRLDANDALRRATAPEKKAALARTKVKRKPLKTRKPLTAAEKIARKAAARKAALKKAREQAAKPRVPARKRA
jgi:probable addiction module antidote protein